MPTKIKHRIIIDTNLWISFLLTIDYSKVDPMFINNEIILIFSKELVDEFIEVAQRPKFRKYFSLSDLEELLKKVRMKALFVSVTSTVNQCRDFKDNFLLALAQDGDATHLITGDKDLLVLGKFGKTKILTITDFIMRK
jgi:putative PIN family toxin of toxin-antitoxin system